MPTRCFAPPADWTANSIKISQTESHHLHHVLRQTTGSEVIAFDGQGREADCEIITTADTGMELAIKNISQAQRKIKLILIQALLKNKAMDWLIQKATELCVATIIPVETEHCVVKLNNEQAKKIERWRKIALAACKQCGNPWLPEIAEPVPLQEFLKQHTGTILHCSLAADAQPLSNRVSEMTNINNTAIAIGPEGDFSTSEYAALKKTGAIPVSLGNITFRAETAALYIISVLQNEADKNAYPVLPDSTT